MGQQEGGFLGAGWHARNSAGSIRPIAVEQEAEEIISREIEADGEGDDDGIEMDGEEEEQTGLEQSGREAEGEEGRRVRGMAAPMRVSARERAEHELTHTPYRAWCPYCVQGRGKNTGHYRNAGDDDDKDAGVPRMAMDYFFMSQEDERANSNPLIVMVDEGTGEKYARAVGHKGIGQEHETDWLIKDMSNELKIWGHPGGPESRIILKSDNEPAVIAVRDTLAKYHGGIVVPEGPAVGESESNGAAEEAGKTVREFVRVLKGQVEAKAKIKIESHDVIVQWMVRWAAMMVSRYLVGKDGRTAYERRRGRKCKVPLAGFGEKVWYKQIREQKERRDKLATEWKEGVWLGHSRSSNETVIGTTDGVVRAYAIKRQDEEER